MMPSSSSPPPSYFMTNNGQQYISHTSSPSQIGCTVVRVEVNTNVSGKYLHNIKTQSTNHANITASHNGLLNNTIETMAIAP